MNRDWTLLPLELLELISENLTSISDYVHFRVVCTAWHVASSPHPHHLPPQLPWLILPRGVDDGEDIHLGSSLSLYDLSQSRTHVLDLPEIQGKRICGSSQGWLVLEKDRGVWLFNPVTRNEISLPSLSAQMNSLFGGNIKGEVDCILKFCIKKAMLSSKPLVDPKCIVVAMFWSSSAIAFCRIGDKCWTTLSIKDELFAMISPYHAIDICYHNGLLYEILRNGHVRIFDIEKPDFKPIDSTIRHEPYQEANYICAVEGGSDEHGLIVFSRDNAYYQHTPQELDMCSMFMLSVDQRKWLNVEAEHLVGNIFFLGGIFHCIALQAADLKLDGWEGNIICYIDPQLRVIIDDVNWYNCTIKVFRIDNSEVITLASDNFLVDDNTYRHYARSPCFLWLTPTLLLN
jgi:hypothetical protein